jgi:hypothetical protein
MQTKKQGNEIVDVSKTPDATCIPLTQSPVTKNEKIEKSHTREKGFNLELYIITSTSDRPYLDQQQHHPQAAPTPDSPNQHSNTDYRPSS